MEFSRYFMSLAALTGTVAIIAGRSRLVALQVFFVFFQPTNSAERVIG
jgi:hypothetical protein